MIELKQTSRIQCIIRIGITVQESVVMLETQTVVEQYITVKVHVNILSLLLE